MCMLIFVKNLNNNEYFTIYRRDLERFLNLKSFFGNNEFNFKIIDKKEDIKHILDTEFVSGDRGWGYDSNTPSVTQLSYKLYPLNIDKDKFLIKWWNNTKPTPADEKESRNILSKGTFVHKLLELYVNDKESRNSDKPLIEQLKILKKCKKPSKKIEKQINNKILNDIRRYIQIAYKDEEIIAKIPNLNELKEELEYLAVNSLVNFIREEMIFTDLVYSEIFISIPNYLQGSIDFVCYLNNKFTILDFKTTSSIDKKTNKPKFKSSSQLEPYSRQLAIYYNLLKLSGMNHSMCNIPDFYICQIHLISGKYKKFTIPKAMVESSSKKLDTIIEWYWCTRNNKEFNYIEPELDEDLELITL